MIPYHKTYYERNREKCIATVVACREKRIVSESEAEKKLRRNRERENHKRWKLLNPERYKQKVRESRIRNAEKRQAYNKLYEQRNKTRRAAKLIEWRKANPEKVAAQRSRRKKDLVKHLDYENKRRARKLATTSENCSAKMLRLKYEKFCRWCCEKLTQANFTVDHIVALSRGGEHKPDNLAACCRKCNASKNNKLLSEWLPTVEMA